MKIILTLIFALVCLSGFGQNNPILRNRFTTNTDVAVIVISTNLVPAGATFNTTDPATSSPAYAVPVVVGRKYWFTGPDLANDFALCTLDDGVNANSIFIPTATTAYVGSAAPGAAGQPVDSQLYRATNIVYGTFGGDFTGVFHGDGSGLTGAWVVPGNNGSDFASRLLTSSNLATMTLVQTLGFPQFTNYTPHFAEQIGVMSFNGSSHGAFIANSTAKGDWIGAWNFPGGVNSMGSPSNMSPGAVHNLTYWDVNGEVTNGWTSAGDGEIVVRNWSTNAYDSGSLIGAGIMGINANNFPFTIDPVGLAFGYVPTNKTANILPGWGEVVWNTSAALKGLAFCSPGLTAGDSGNSSLLLLDAEHKLFRIPRQQQGVFQPDDVLYTLTVSGVVTAPVAGDVYKNNGARLHVAATSLVAGAGTITFTSISAPAASGTLTRIDHHADSTPDTTITFSASAVTRFWQDAFLADPTTGLIYMTNNTVQTAAIVASGSVATPIVYKGAGTYVATASDYTIVGNAASVIVQLPAASTVPGRIYVMKAQTGTGAVNNMSCVTPGGQTIDGFIGVTITNSITAQSDGTNWVRTTAY